jgi:two-component system chemotaxis response regulator CheY
METRMQRVLVVDDSATMRKIIAKGLREAGFGRCEVIEAADGASALGALRGAEFDLVLCDINMPGMDGLSLVRSAREDLTISPDLPIVMITTEGGLEKVSRLPRATDHRAFSRRAAAREDHGVAALELPPRGG